MKSSLENHLARLNQTGAILLVAAVCDLFPDVLLMGGQGGGDRFYYDFIFPFEFQETFLAMIEERMRHLIREKRSVQHLEMMPSNAAAMMKHHGQEIIAEKLSQLECALVSMCKMGEFVAYCPLPFQKNLQLPYLKVFESFPLNLPGRKTIRIVGAVSEQKETLKELAKHSYASHCHLTLAKQLGLFEPMDEEGMWFWRPRGEALRELLVEWWRQEHLKQNFSLISSPTSFLGEGKEVDLSKSHQQYFLRCGEPKVAEMAWILSAETPDPTSGLFSPGAFFADRAHLFCSEEKVLQECISSLHFILKMPKLLDFEFEIVLSVPSSGAQKTRTKRVALLQQALENNGLDYTVEKTYRFGSMASIEVRIADALGRRWTGPFLSLSTAEIPGGSGCILTWSTFGSLERWTALLLEKRGGWLPLWLAPEQVRILVASRNVNPYANEVLQVLRTQEVRATIESSQEKLKTQLYQAIQERVPYVVLLGEREEKTKSLTVRGINKDEQNISLEVFCTRLKVESRSGNSELTN